MPFLWPKMNSRIFGFQRLVWCPKWTPASRSSFIVTAAKWSPFPSWPGPSKKPGAGSTLRELEPGTRSALPVLLALLDARVARQEAGRLQARPQGRVELDQRPRDAVTHRPGLSRLSAA